jgi:hypothetical protein
MRWSIEADTALSSVKSIVRAQDLRVRFAAKHPKTASSIALLRQLDRTLSRATVVPRSRPRRGCRWTVPVSRGVRGSRRHGPEPWTRSSARERQASSVSVDRATNGSLNAPSRDRLVAHGHARRHGVGRTCPHRPRLLHRHRSRHQPHACADRSAVLVTAELVAGR